MLAVFISTFMTSVEVTIVTTALPSIISELHGLAYQSWIMSAYLFTTAITTPIYGKLADMMGRKKLFMWGIFVFTLGSFLSGLSTSIWMLIFFRAIQGIGAGAVMPLTFTIIADNYDFKQRAKVLAMNNTAWGISALVGPLIGGFLVDTLSWHWVFFVNVPLGIFVFLICIFGYKETFKHKDKIVIDWNGIVLLSVGLISLLIGVQFLDNAPLIAGILILAALIIFIFFVRYERDFANPLISPKMFANRTFGIQILTATLLSGVLIGYQIYFPIWLQSLYRVSATVAGLVITPSSVMWFLASFFVGGLIARFVPKRVIILVTGVLFLAYGTMIFAQKEFPIWAFYVITAINGTGMGIVISMNTILSQHLVFNDQVGSATAVLTLGRSLGQTVMTGVFGAILNLVIRLNLNGIPFSSVNKVISSSFSGFVPQRQEIDAIVLNSLHGVFIAAVAVLVIVIVINVLDPNQKIIK